MYQRKNNSRLKTGIKPTPKSSVCHVHRKAKNTDQYKLNYTMK
jgi:hypothetical protein